jgi:hypothetical protein
MAKEVYFPVWQVFVFFALVVLLTAGCLRVAAGGAPPLGLGPRP